MRSPAINSVSWMIGVSALILFLCSSLRHALFQSTALDLAVFDQWVYLASQGLPPISSFFGFHLLGDHAAFILYVIALLYKIYPDVHWLFAIQAIALAVGAVPIYALSLQSGLSISYARTIALSYLLYPALFNINFFTDFRPEAIAVPALLWAMWAGMTHRTLQLILAVALTLSCKEILSLTVIALGIWLWLIQHRRLYGLGCIFIGTVWYLITIGYLVPMLRNGQAGGVVFFRSLGDSPTQILWNIITNPALILGKFFAPETLFYYLLLLLPVLIGLHWRTIMVILPGLPMLLLNILSDYSAQRDLVHHYSLPIFPFIIVWLVHSISHYQKHQKRSWLKPHILLAWSIAAFLLLAKYEFFVTRYLSNLPNLNSLYTAVNLVQTHGSVLTTSRIAPHLSQRPVIKLTNMNLVPDGVNNFEYILINSNTTNKPEFSSSLITQLQSNKAFHLIYQQDNIYLFTKN
ncbi:DUF2079 domain-containing protein [Nostoc sp. FACHB-87]|uniref:DUF2079 domain-containing protein n=2 Tax=Nostocales TaxID=1161 RepID=UPI0016856193|nr:MULTISPECIES: DUF2079 domain-containing protein [Nostocaceae]MBD2300540.1 DUF2079 domain-containing protein [Nostoc sp. FACHB-190]MBD2453783.1 DUF2079 domain-containing protein [Nostoc sp. FACHB-87]MBD2475261.1 DUF2079 domain-containing protein [Anabaena sp. FACHB-83]